MNTTKKLISMLSEIVVSMTGRPMAARSRTTIPRQSKVLASL